MKYLLLVVVLLVPSLGMANGCWNANARRWEWCPADPYESSSGGSLYGAGAEVLQSAGDSANALECARIERERIQAEARSAAAHDLAKERRQLRWLRYLDSRRTQAQ